MAALLLAALTPWLLCRSVGATFLEVLAANAKDTILVTAADGSEGMTMVSALVALRREAMQELEIIAGVDNATSWNARIMSESGAEVREISNPPKPRDFHGATWVFVLAPLTADRFARGRDFINAALDAGVKHAVLLSVIGAGPLAPPSLGAYYALEQHLAKVWPADSWIVLRTYFYQQNLLLWGNDVRTTRIFRLPLASPCFAPLYEADVAKVVFALVRDSDATTSPTPSNVSRNVFNLTGPRLLSGGTLAQTAAAAIGAPGLMFLEVNREVASDILEAVGSLDRSEADLLLDILDLQTEPYSCHTWPSGDFQMLTGAPPTDVAQFFMENMGDFRPADVTPTFALRVPEFPGLHIAEMIPGGRRSAEMIPGGRNAAGRLPLSSRRALSVASISGLLLGSASLLGAVVVARRRWRMAPRSYRDFA